ncbi:MAG: tRNA pseudouridine(38-40) synthase TruA [Pseudomonadota bacterium]
MKTLRVALGIEYDGTGFHGWQAQTPDVATVQACMTAAVSRVANHPVILHCAGRTDTGVHALCQVAHFDTSADRSDRAWVLGGNANLPPGVNLLWARSVTGDFHARFSAVARHYRYGILNRSVRSGLDRHRWVWVHHPLDAERMQAAGQFLVGEQDFSSYRALSCQARSPIRTIHYLRVIRQGNRVILSIGANGFLHHMVRNIAGVLIAIGQGDYPPEWAAELLTYRDRTQGDVTAAPWGLYFAGVDYPEGLGLAGLSTCSEWP